MRLSSSQQSLLSLAAKQHFGNGARIWLFGSRIDDSARGGDYDLLVQATGRHAGRLIDAKLAFLADLHETPEFAGEKIDVVLHATELDGQKLPIHEVALADGIELV